MSQHQLSSNMIVATSGFLLPVNNYFTEFEPDPDHDSIFNRSIVVNNSSVYEFYKKQEVFKSDSITKLYTDYNSHKTFENYVKLLDVAMSILKCYECNVFFKLQMTNKYLSPISMNFCKDLFTLTKDPYQSKLTDMIEPINYFNSAAVNHDKHYNTYIKFLRTYKDYAIIPYNARFVLNNNLTESDVLKNVNDISKPGQAQSWENLLSTLFLKPSIFEVFFRYIFVDQY